MVGRQAVRELLGAGSRAVREVLLASGMQPAGILDDIIDLSDEAGVSIREVARGRIEKLAEGASHQGVLALAAPLPTFSLEEALELEYDLNNANSASGGLTDSGGQVTGSVRQATGSGAAPALVLDGVSDPGNLGALLRTASCAGTRAVVLPRHRAARITPVVTKSAAGAVEHLRFVAASGIPSALTEFSRLNVWTVGLESSADVSLWDLDLEDAPAALVLGAEGRGLSRLARKRCDALVHIPTEGALGTLNVTAAGAVALFEFARRRGIR